MRLGRTLEQTGLATALYLKAVQREVGLTVVFLFLFPVGFLFFLHTIIAPGLLAQVVVGTIMMETALTAVNVVAQSIGQEKETKLYDLWVSLPISPLSYVVANAVALLPVTLASDLLTLSIGIGFFGLPLGWGALPLLLLGLLLVWAATLGIGFLIGVYGRTPRQVNQLAQFVGIVMTFFAPVFYPVTALPEPLRLVAYAWPITWGEIFLVDLVNGLLAAAVGPALVLLAFTGLWIGLIAHGLRWRAP